MTHAKDSYDSLFGECNVLIGQVQALVNEAINNNATVFISPLLASMQEKIHTAARTISNNPDPSMKVWLSQQLEQVEMSYSVLNAQYQELVV
jgi:hypothetical protein